PPGYQLDEFQGQFRPRAMLELGLGLTPAVGPRRLPLTLLPLGESLAVDVEPSGDGQGEDLAGRPEGMDDDQAEHDPVVSPTDQGLGSAGDERVVVHAGAV